jgi:histidyl-tRNA synthetase
MDKRLETEPYKGTRDFYPGDMAIQRYIFDTWAKTAELFGFERYDASILEPSELYKSKGAENEELVNEQTYTFIDRGDREVTLRPEMTPTVARMVAAKRRELSFPVRWYSIPNLFRYERPQRGRLREHWQLNCDMFGVDDLTADVEIITLAYHVMKAFGAKDSDFEIRVNNRELMANFFAERYGIKDPEILAGVNRTLDQKQKVTDAIFNGLLEKFVQKEAPQLRKDLDLDLDAFVNLLNPENQHSTLVKIKNELQSLGIKVVFDATLARGFSYYTGTIFEIFDTSPENNRSLLGGGRYDNLTKLFDDEPIPGVGFGVGDVRMRDFLVTHDLLPKNIHVTAPTVSVIPTDASFNIEGEKIAHEFRKAGISASVDLSSKKLGKKISAASEAGVAYIIVVGEDEVKAKKFTLKNLATTKEEKGPVPGLVKMILGNVDTV